MIAISAPLNLDLLAINMSDLLAFSGIKIALTIGLGIFVGTIILKILLRILIRPNK